MDRQHAELIRAMIKYEEGNAHRIQHFMKVHGFAAAIGRLEGLSVESQFVLETAAIVHDIGILPSLEKYGSDRGKYQELEGPPVADRLLREVGGYSEAVIERVKYLVGHHHTYTDIDGDDYQILVEADFLVNLFENSAHYESAENVWRTHFRTGSGKEMLRCQFLAARDGQSRLP